MRRLLPIRYSELHGPRAGRTGQEAGAPALRSTQILKLFSCILNQRKKWVINKMHMCCLLYLFIELTLMMFFILYVDSSYSLVLFHFNLKNFLQNFL